MVFTEAQALQNFKGISNSYRGYQKGFEENKWRAEVGIECKVDPMCYAKYLDGKDIKKTVADAKETAAGFFL